MQWVGLPMHTGAYVIAHCGGSFDFQMILRYFLSDQVLRMKKVKAPLMTGNKIVTAVINELKLIDSYAFVGHALAQFPAVFNILQKRKKDFTHIRLIDLSSGIILDLFLTGAILNLIIFTLVSEKHFFSGMMNKLKIKLC